MIKKIVMQSARHLSATRMAWVMNRSIQGHDFTGCTKRVMAEIVADGRIYGWSHRKATPEKVASIIASMIQQPNTRGEAGAR